MRSLRPDNLSPRSAARAIVCALAVAAQLLVVPLHGLHHHDHHHDHDHAHHEQPAAQLAAADHASADCATCALINQSRAGFDVAPRAIVATERTSLCHFQPAAQPPAAFPDRIASPRAPPMA